MAKVNQVTKRVRMEDLKDIVKFQLLTYCHINKISVSDADLNCLTLLAIVGQNELTSFCTWAHTQNIFSSVQSVRNCLTKAEKKGLVNKEGKNKKLIYINKDVQVVATTPILLDYKFLYYLESEKS